MEEYNKYIRFDWAMKHMLRDKANFSVLEGLLEVLIGEKMKIEEILESESNQNDEFDKYNRVDIKARNSDGHIVIVEVQLTREFYFLHRLLYGTSKAVTEHISLGERYDRIKKVYSISILYFDLGEGDDYVYHGTTKFEGLNTGNQLIVKQRVRDTIISTYPGHVFPEYYIIRVNDFDKVPENALEEWMQYLKTGRINEGTVAPGLQDARKKLLYLQMSKTDRQAYDKHLDNIMVQNDVMETAREEGREEGLLEGRAEGREEGRAQGRAEGLEEGRAEGRSEGREEMKLTIARNLLDIGFPVETISQTTGLSIEEIKSLR